MGDRDAAIVDYDRWTRALVELAPAYLSADPFPHAVLDDFLAPAAADRMLDEFPPLAAGDWIQYQHLNEHKFGRRDRAAFGPSLGATVDELTSPRFVALLERLTGIDGLEADPTLEGGGVQQSVRGGFLNLHTDFSGHPLRPDWRRRVNVLVYLNKDWPEEWGGHLELWDGRATRLVRRVRPAHNRVVIFNTGADSLHGHPEPLTCPEGRTRKSLALYYFVRDPASRVRATRYRPRPGDGARGLLVYADNLAVRGYDLLKRRLGFDDRWISRVLRGTWGRLRK